MAKSLHNGNSTQKNRRSRLLAEIKEALESISYGSIEIFIQNKTVTQITVRNIKKTSVEIEESDDMHSREIKFSSEDKQVRKSFARKVS